MDKAKVAERRPSAEGQDRGEPTLHSGSTTGVAETAAFTIAPVERNEPVCAGDAGQAARPIKHTSLRIDRDVLSLLKVVALQHDISFNAFVLDAIDQKLRSMGYPPYEKMVATSADDLRKLYAGPLRKR